MAFEIGKITWNKTVDLSKYLCWGYITGVIGLSGGMGVMGVMGHKNSLDLPEFLSAQRKFGSEGIGMIWWGSNPIYLANYLVSMSYRATMPQF